MRPSLKKTILEFIQVVLGNACSAFAVACFALPYDMVVSGLTGVGRMVNYYFGFGVTETVAVCNVILFVIGFAMLGKKFAASIVVGTVTFPLFLGIFENATMLHHLVEDPLLAAICAGIIDGVGLGLILRVGGSSGGIDVPPIILNRKLGWKIAPVMYMIDVCIFLIQIPLTKTNGIILGILYALIYSMVMNKILVMDQGGVQIMIFSQKAEEINEKILEIGFGTSIMHVTGGYMREPQDVVYCVVSNRNLNAVKRASLNIDPTAFMTISNVNEVNGNGFTTWFRDEDYVPEVSERHSGIELTKKGRKAGKNTADAEASGK
jgi:uncharacterized membrane-anchored protein YitT (DUF2179 family)